MFEDRKEGIPLNSTSAGAANIFLNTGNKTKATSDGTVIHLDSAKPADIGVHINTTLSIASSKKIRVLFILNFLLSVVCMVLSSSVAFYYWNEMISMKKQMESIQDQFSILNLKDSLQQDKVQHSALVSNLRPSVSGPDVREARMDAAVEAPASPRKYYVEDLGDDMLLVDITKKKESTGLPALDLPIFQKEPLVVHFNGGMSEVHLGEKPFVGPWERDTSVSSKHSESKIELNGDYVTVQESGLYLIYAQIVYLSRGPNVFYVWAHQEAQSPTLLSTCATGDVSAKRELNKSQMSCSVQTVARLHKGETVNLAQREPNRTLWLRPGNSYLGFIKLSS